MERINVTKCQLPDRKVFDSYVDQLFQTGWITNRGELVQQLEKRLAEHLGVKNVVLVANGTLALQIAYRVLGFNNQVITTPFSFIATASSLAWEGLDVIFADIDEKTLNITSAEIKKKITDKTSGIVPVHVYGNPCEVDELGALASTHGLPIVYDAAHAFDIKYQNKSVLNWGDISILSFHATKLFHTIEGGALIINDDALCYKARDMINFGIIGPDAVISLGINAKMNEFQAAMGLSLLDKVEPSIGQRKLLTAQYHSSLSETLIRQQWNSNASCNYGYYPVIFSSESQLLNCQKALNDEDVYPRRYFSPSLARISECGWPEQQTPIADDIASRVLCLPLYAELDVKYVIKISEIINSSL
jgi:dTDP-4-amino-4,6-dideoxygalactose transaminase